MYILPPRLATKQGCPLPLLSNITLEVLPSSIRNKMCTDWKGKNKVCLYVKKAWLSTDNLKESTKINGTNEQVW